MLWIHVSLQGLMIQHPTTLATPGAFVLVGIFGLFIYNLTDPLQMRYARGLSLREERIVRGLSGVQNPAMYLKWRAVNQRRLDSLR